MPQWKVQAFRVEALCRWDSVGPERAEFAANISGPQFRRDQTAKMVTPSAITAQLLAAVLAARRVPFPVVVIAAAATTALLRFGGVR
jgi:hypothetical protein